MPATLAARAPTRLDFGGGWTDVPPYPAEEGGCVCNVAIARYATVHIGPLPDGSSDEPVLVGSDRPGESALARAAVRRAGLSGVTLGLRNDFPIGAGLGGSSAAGVAVVGALARWRGEQPSPEVLAERSRAIEVDDLHVAGGRQDHYAAAFGGALGLRFGDGADVRVQRIPLDGATTAAIERRCIVGYTGQSRISGETITAVIEAYRARAPRVVQALARMKALAAEMIRALEAGAIDGLGTLVEEHWDAQRSLHPAITTPLIDEVLARTRDAGAIGGKALGASGGGCVMVIAAEECVDEVRQAMGALTELLPFRVDTDGFHVIAAGA